MTTSLIGREWLACFGLAALLPLLVEASKLLRRRRSATAAAPLDVQQALAPARSGLQSLALRDRRQA